MTCKWAKQCMSLNIACTEFLKRCSLQGHRAGTAHCMFPNYSGSAGLFCQRTDATMCPRVSSWRLECWERLGLLSEHDLLWIWRVTWRKKTERPCSRYFQRPWGKSRMYRLQLLLAPQGFAPGSRLRKKSRETKYIKIPSHLSSEIYGLISRFFADHLCSFQVLLKLLSGSQ